MFYAGDDGCHLKERIGTGEIYDVIRGYVTIDVDYKYNE